MIPHVTFRGLLREVAVRSAQDVVAALRRSRLGPLTRAIGDSRALAVARAGLRRLTRQRR